MTFRLPLFQRASVLVENDGRPSQQFQTWWQSVVRAIEAQEAAQALILEQLQDQLDAITAAQEAAAAAQTAADAANDAAEAAMMAATSANAAVDAVETAVADLDTRVTALETP